MKRGIALEERKLVRYGLQGVALGAIVTVLVLLVTVRGDTLAQLRVFSSGYVPLLFAMVAVAWLCNGARMWLMCRAAGHRLRFRQAIAVSLSTEFGIAATPGGVGGTVIRLTLLRRAGVPLTTAGSLIAADAAVDLAFFSLLAPFAIVFLLHDDLLSSITGRLGFTDAVFVLCGVAAAAAGLSLLLRLARFQRLVESLLGMTAFGRRRRLPARYRHLRLSARRTLHRLLGSLAFLWHRRKGALLLNFCVASVQWCCRYLLLPVILLSLGIHVNPLPLFLVQGALFALSLLVVAPGGGGSVELLTALILPGFAPVQLAGVIVLVWRFFTYHLYIIGGGAMFFWASRHLNELFPARPNETGTAEPGPS